MDDICKAHRFRGPSWKNTDPQKWCTDAFEIAKCYMAPDGYSRKSSLMETDFNGILSLLINNTSFETKLQANLGTEPNIFTKARNVGREIRHSSDHLLSDSDLRDYIDDLINLLCDPVYLVNDLSAQDAIRKLKMLKTNNLTIHEKDIIEALSDNIKETFSEQHRDFLQKIQDHYSKLQADSVAGIDKIVSVRRMEFEDLANKLTDDITRLAEQKKLEIEQIDQIKEKNKEEKQLKDFQEDLINHYIKEEARISVVPLAEKRKVPLIDFYVRPPLRVKSISFGNKERISENETNSAETNVRSFRDLFIKDDNHSYKQVYIEAPAGYGKTCFSQSLALTWCQAHSPDKTLTDKFSTDDIDAIKNFDFLFLLHLRDFHNSGKCILVDLIFEMVFSTLARRTKYSQQFVEDTLNNCRCIVILDGLDEWVHPVTCRRKPEIPHNNHHYGCTVICTTRPWKMSTVGLSADHIDLLVEISRLDEKSSKQLEIKAFKILNENQVPYEEQKNLSDLGLAVSQVEISDIFNIPFLKLQLIGLWFGRHSLGKSRCEVYSNVTEFTLERATKQRHLLFEPKSSPDSIAIPNCMIQNKQSIFFLNTLIKLGKLAFRALFQEIRESRIIFKRDVALMELEKDELEFCLNVGLLSQTEDTSLVEREGYLIWFQHKSVQEYFAALYLATGNTTEESHNIHTILNVCKSLPEIFEMSDVFRFLSGMNSKLYSEVSRKLQDVVEHDNITCEYRSTVSLGQTCEALESYQSMQIACFEEAIKNDTGKCTLSLQDLVLRDSKITNDDLLALSTIAPLSTCSVKSLFVEGEYMHRNVDLTKILKSLKFYSLHKVAFLSVKYDDIYTNILADSAGTLKSLQLGGKEMESNIPILPRLIMLQAIGIHNITMSHENIASLYRCIRNQMVLIHVSLWELTCRDHYMGCSVSLNLSQHDRLQSLDLRHITLCDLHVNSTCLERCYVADLPDTALSSLLSDLHGSAVVSYLELWNISNLADMLACAIPTLLRLQELDLRYIDLRDSGLPLSPHMARLKRVDLWDVTMSAFAWRRLLIDTICKFLQSVTVRLVMCMRPAEEEWEDVITGILLSSPSTQIKDLNIYDDDASCTILYPGTKNG